MSVPLSIIIAPDSFKGSVSAKEAATAIARGWQQARPHDTLTLLPQADGGEGTLDAIEHAVPDAVRHPAGLVTGPNGLPTPGEWLELPRQVAVVELAQCSGLTLMDTPDPLGATTRGMGDVIRATLDAGMRSLVIALGGSASTDGGAGALAALGLGLFDKDGHVLADGGAALVELARCERDMLSPPPGGVTLLADVTAPLLGPHGAAAVFGPQKGADTADVRLLGAALTTFARHLGGDPAAAGSGAAGGTAYGFATLWGASIESGARFVQQLTGLDDAISNADVVLTGEGQFDETSTTGKVVGELLALAAHHCAQTGIIAGRFGAHSGHWDCSLTELAGSPEAALAEPLRFLELAGRTAALHFGGDL
jgi:glycerate kinase